MAKEKEREWDVWMRAVRWIRNENGIKCDTKIKRMLTFVSAGWWFLFLSRLWFSLLLFTFLLFGFEFFFPFSSVLRKQYNDESRTRCEMNRKRAGCYFKWKSRKKNTTKEEMKTRSLYFSFFTHAIRFLPHSCASNILFSEWNEMSVGGTSVDMLILAHLRTCSKSRVASSTLWYRAVSSVVSVIVTDIVSVYTM